MKKIISVFFASLITLSANSQITKLSDATIANVNFEITKDKKMAISYDIVGGKNSEKFDVSFFVKTESGNKIEAKTATGDLKGVKAGGGKHIYWDMGKDIAYLDENIFVEVKAQQVNPKVIPYTSKGKALIWSTIYPGAGSTRLGQNKAHLMKGIAAYAFVGLSIKYNKDAVSSYDSYISETDPSKRNTYIDDTEKNQTLSKVFLYGAISIWAWDYMNILWLDNKTDTRKSRISFIPSVDPLLGTTNLALVYTFK
jgi:hypothetical protein